MASGRPSVAHPTHETLLNAKQMHNGLKRICSFSQANNLLLPPQAEIASAVPSPVHVPPSGGTPNLRPRPAGSVSKALGDFVAIANKAAFPGAAMSDNGGNGWTRLNAGFVFVFAEYVLIANAITRRPPNLFQKLFDPASFGVPRSCGPGGLSRSDRLKTELQTAQIVRLSCGGTLNRFSFALRRSHPCQRLIAKLIIGKRNDGTTTIGSFFSADVFRSGRRPPRRHVRAQTGATDFPLR